MREKDLIIYPRFKSLSKWRKWGYKKLIQNKDFEYSILIINKNKEKFSGGIIKDVEITPVEENINYKIVSDKIYPIKPLSHGEIHKVLFDKSKADLAGTFRLSFELETENQIIPFSDLYFNIISEESFNQKITNILLVVLTILMFGTSICSLIF